ncbi:MAG: glucuronate isomerase [Bacillus subtilis]|nr:glucuronate isomerase [Bacillus subtilis]
MRSTRKSIANCPRKPRRKLIQSSNVEVVCTTDDPVDSLDVARKDCEGHNVFNQSACRRFVRTKPSTSIRLSFPSGSAS